MSIFTQVAHSKLPSNTFNLSHDRKFSMKFGEITPCFIMETIPGDTVKMSTSQLLRFAPLVAPVMHQVNIYVHSFFVPNRILWDNWNNFISGGEDGLDQSVMPTIKLTQAPNGSLADYLGIPFFDATSHPNGLSVNALPFAAYQMIYDEYYRDQNLIDKVDVKLVDGDNTGTVVGELATIRNRAWQHDYFTSGLPWTQKGNEVTIPLGAEADILFNYNQGDKVYNANTGAINTAVGQLETTAGFPEAVNITNNGELGVISFDNSANLKADLSQANAASINDLRQAFRLQEWLEKNARGGSRINEFIKIHFNVNTSDSRLQRPEYLGGGKTPVKISEVLQNTQSLTDTTPQGNMAGHGIATGATASFKHFSEEHGYIISMVSIMPKSSYQQGIPKHFLKRDKFDYFFNTFAKIGEQPILNAELYTDEADGLDGETFAYTPRYAEYKHMFSTVHGEFRSTLDFWHIGRQFTTRPTLSKEFIEMTDAETDRIFAVAQAEQLYVHMYHRVKARRNMPYFGTPTL